MKATTWSKRFSLHGTSNPLAKALDILREGSCCRIIYRRCLTAKLFLSVGTMVLCFLLLIGLADVNLKAGVEYTKGNYRVGPGDVLSLHVYHQPDLAQSEILVKDDGFASFNGVGEILVAGKTLDQVNQMLRTRIGELIIDPIVTVTVLQVRPGTIYLAGAVKRPGMLQLASAPTKGAEANKSMPRVDLRLSNVLASSGGLALNADLSRIEIRQANSSEIIHVNLWKMLKEGDRSEDVLVQSGDSIYVPELAHTAINDQDYNLLLQSSIGPGTFPVRIIGEVETPGIYELSGNSPFLNSVIAQAGGYRPGANRQMLAIRRFSGESMDTLYVDPNQSDIVLRPNDVVFVSEKSIYSAGRFFETVAKVLSPFSSAASTVFNFAWASSMRK